MPPGTFPGDPTLPVVDGWTFRAAEDPARVWFTHDACGHNGNTPRSNVEALVAEHVRARHV